MHLTAEELEALVAPAEREGKVRSRRELDAHLGACVDCREQLDRQRQLQAVLARPGVAAPADLGQTASGCPADSSLWYEIVVGMASEAEARRWLAHAVACAACGAALRTAIEEMASEPAPTEMKSRGARGGWWQGVPAWAAVAAAVIIAACVVWYYHSAAQSSPAALLARAYQENRNLALRLPGAGYAPLARTRGGGAARSPALLAAEDSLATALERRPNDPTLLDLRARAGLLEWNYRQALADAQHGLLAAPDSAPLLTDLASAYFERAEATDRPADYDAALDAVGRALARAPRDRVAWYNRAIVSERLQLYVPAISAWQQYLRLDPKGPWADEARRHLAADQQVRQRHDAAFARPLLSPTAFVVAAARGDPSLDGRIEAYQNLALLDWLPAAFPIPPAVPSASARQALTALAAIVLRQHQDSWLTDLLAMGAASSGSGFSRGVAALARAIVRDQMGDPRGGTAAARQAAAQFAASHNSAGHLRAELAWGYGLGMRELAAPCLARLRTLETGIGARPYVWLRADGLLEEDSCHTLLTESAGGAVAAALAMAQRAGYRSLALRALSFLADAPRAPEDPRRWSLHERALTAYWQGATKPMRGYQLYITLALRSAQLGRPFAARDFARAAVDRIALSPELGFQVVSRRLLATYELQCGDAVSAHRQLALADAAVARMPADAATANLLAINELDLAQAAADAGKLGDAAADLKRYRNEQQPAENLNVRALPYYDLLGRIAAAEGREPDARRAWNAAVWISQHGARGLSDDRDQLAWERQNLAPYRGLVDLDLRARRDPMAALDLWETGRGAPLAPPRSTTDAPRLGTLAALGAAAVPSPLADRLVRPALRAVGGDEILTYALLPHSLAIWVSGVQGVRWRRVPLAAVRLRAAASSFAALCADPASDPAFLKARAGQLYQWLIAPVGAWLPPDAPLVIEADDDLARISFAALRNPAGAWLGALHPLRNSPGMAYARLAHADAAVSAADAALAVGNPALGAAAGEQGFVPLPAAAAEARQVASGFARSQVFIGRQATLAAVLAALPRAEVFHFAGHAEALPGGAGLLLAAPAGMAPLTARQLTPARLRRCRLAFLAACDGAAGAGGGLLAPAGLVRAFLRAGVPSVVAARWRVESASAEILSAAFYAALLKGNSPAASLQRAEAAVRVLPGHAAPYYWASYAVFNAQP